MYPDFYYTLMREGPMNINDYRYRAVDEKDRIVIERIRRRYIGTENEDFRWNTVETIWKGKNWKA